MDSNTDPPYPDAIQQLPRSFKPLIWKIVFVPLLIANFLFGFLVFWLIYNAYHQSAGLMILLALPLPLFILSIIDLIAVLFYIKTQHPHGVLRAICYIALIVIVFVVIVSVVYSFIFYAPLLVRV